MKRFAFATLFFSLCLSSFACGGGNKEIADLPLVWTAGKTPAASTPVDKAFAAGPLEVGQFSDERKGEKDVVGTFQENGFKVRTKGDVRAFWAGRVRAAIENAGGKFGAPANARFDAALLDFDCIEGNTFQATVRMRVTVTKHDGATQPWTKTYEGTAKKWGRTHSAENFTEALSSALNEATRKMVQDPELATAILGKPAAP